MASTIKRVTAGTYRTVDGAFEICRTKEGSLHSTGVAWYWRNVATGKRSGLLDTLSAARTALVAHLEAGVVATPTPTTAPATKKALAALDTLRKMQPFTVHPATPDRRVRGKRGLRTIAGDSAHIRTGINTHLLHSLREQGLITCTTIYLAGRTTPDLKVVGHAPATTTTTLTPEKSALLEQHRAELVALVHTYVDNLIDDGMAGGWITEGFPTLEDSARELVAMAADYMAGLVDCN